MLFKSVGVSVIYTHIYKVSIYFAICGQKTIDKVAYEKVYNALKKF